MTISYHSGERIQGIESDRTGSGSITSIISTGTWSTAPANLSNATDNDLSTSSDIGWMDHTMTSYNDQTVQADWGEEITEAITVKYQHRQNGGGGDATTYYIETSSNGSSWTTRDTFVLTTNDTYTDRTVILSSYTFRYMRIRINTNNTFRVRYLKVYAFQHPNPVAISIPTDVPDYTRFEETDTRKMYTRLPVTSLSLTGLKSYYTFNEASGTLVNSATTIGSSDSLGTASDSASTSNITYAQTGKIGDAISFNGSTSSSRVDIGSSLSQFNFLHEVNATASFNFWYKKTAVDTNFRTIWAQHYGTSGQRGVRLGFTGTRGIQFLIYNNTGNTTLGDSTSGFTANDTDWHMFTLTWDLSLATNTLQVYHDGVLDHQANRTTSGENGNSGLVPSLGDDKGGDGNWYGLLDEMSVWDRVLSANDVTLLYNSGSGTTPDNAEEGGWVEKGTT